MDNGISILILLIAFLAGAGLVWTFFRREMLPGDAELLERAIAEVRAILGDVFTEDDVRSLAGWFWDMFVKQSDYWTREQFVERIVRAVMASRGSAQPLRVLAEAWGMIPPQGTE